MNKDKESKIEFGDGRYITKTELWSLETIMFPELYSQAIDDAIGVIKKVDEHSYGGVGLLDMVIYELEQLKSKQGEQ